MRALAARLTMAAISAYQAFRGPRPSPCRFTPTCSSYAKEAIETHGVCKGIYLGFRRILRCHPWGSWGYDPVPESRRAVGART